MPYGLKLFGYFLIAAVPLLILEQWLHALGLVMSVAFALTYAYPVIVLSGWLFGRKNLEAWRHYFARVYPPCPIRHGKDQQRW